MSVRSGSHVHMLFLTALLVSSSRCASTGRAHRVLTDCTQAYSAHFGKPVAHLPSDVSRRAIAAAGDWASRSCYLPCEYQMCGAVREHEDGKITVYITAAFSLEDNEPWIVPEAEVVLDDVDLRPVGEIFWHSACRMAQRECRAP